MRSKTLLGVATLAAVSLLTSGCLSAGKPATPEGGEGDRQRDRRDHVRLRRFRTPPSRRTVDEGLAEENGIKLELTQSDAFEEMISTRVGSGSVPDIAIFPQPGILQTMAKQGKLAELGTQLDLAKLEADIVPGFLDAATVDGKIYGAPMSMNGKSFYWYNKPAFEAAGYKVPQTHDELKALVDKIKGEGKTPFCFGLESGSEPAGGHRLD